MNRPLPLCPRKGTLPNGDDMNVHVWLDVPLAVFGLLVMSPWIWMAFRRRRSVRANSLGRFLPAAMLLLFFLGLGSFMMAGIDVGLAAWEDAHRPRSEPFDIRQSSYNIASHEEAPDFSLPALDEDRSIRLSDFRGRKPVVLIFGSFG